MGPSVANAWLGPRSRPRRGLTTRKFRGSIAQRLISLSTLRGDGRPSPTQDSLPAAGPALPDGIGYPRGSDKRFHIASDPPFPSFLAQGRPCRRRPEESSHGAGIWLR